MLWALPLLGLSGCVATQRDVLEIEQQSDEIKAQVQELKKTLSSVQANQADISVKMDQMHADVSTFTEVIRDAQERMLKLASKLDDLQSVLGQKVSALGETLSRKQSTDAAAAQKAAEETRAAVQAVQQAAQKATEDRAAPAPTPSQLYRSAQESLNAKNYRLAAEDFEAYLQKYPKGELVELAVYYLGDARSGLKDWEKAARQYALLLDRFPKSDLTPSARLKYAVSLIRLKSHLEEARRYLQSIPEDFPKSPEAAAATKWITQIDAAAQKNTGRRR